METDKQIIAKLEGENKLLRKQIKNVQNRFEEQIDELSLIRELGEGLLSAQNFEPVCMFILNFIIDHTMAQNCSIMLLDSDVNRLFFACASDYRGKAYSISAKDIFAKNNLKYSFKCGQGAAGHAVDFKKPLIINDVNTSPIFDSEHNGIEDIASLLSVPLLLGDDPLGVLNLSHSEIDAFESNEINLFSIIANLVAIAVQNTLNFESLRSEISKRRKVEEELRCIHGELEERIQERTNELTRINKRLKKEIKQKEIAQSVSIQAKEHAERANKAKSDFLANMSHELRTPLNHIIGFTELVVDEHFGAVNDLQDEYLSDVLASSKHLLDLINDILDLSKIEAGKLELELSDIVLQDLLNSSLTMVKEKALVHGIRLERDVNGVPDMARMDERKVKQILYNLLSNAAKFTPKGGKIILAVRTIEGIVRSGYRWSDSKRVLIFEKPAESNAPDENDIGQCLQFSVTDTGIGIEKIDQNRIFRAFEQADELHDQACTGTGLGLSLSKNLVELHGGKIWVESEGKNKGSTFRFIIPLSSD